MVTSIFRMISDVLWEQNEVADLELLHDGRRLRPERRGGDRPHSHYNHKSRLIMTSDRPGNCTSVTAKTTRCNARPVLLLDIEATNELQNHLSVTWMQIVV